MIVDVIGLLSTDDAQSKLAWTELPLSSPPDLLILSSSHRELASTPLSRARSRLILRQAAETPTIKNVILNTTAAAHSVYSS